MRSNLGVLEDILIKKKGGEIYTRGQELGVDLVDNKARCNYQSEHFKYKGD